MKRKVVVTGMGAVTPIGTGKDAFWQSVKEGKNGIAPIRAFDTQDFKAKLAAEVHDFAPEEYMGKKEAKRMDRFCQFAIAAADLCMKDAQLDSETLTMEERQRFGVMTGSGVGGFYTMAENQTKYIEGGNRKVSPFMIPMIIIDMAAGQIAMHFQLNGPAQALVTACASSTDAIGQAFRMIKDGYADRMIAGGSEAVITPLAIAGFSNMTALSLREDPDRASIPFDQERNGFVMGEGGGMLLLEEYECAQARGAHIYAEVLGYGSTADAYHITAPDPEAKGAAQAMRLALSEGGISPRQLSYINAHGTSTPANDAMETLAIKKALGEKAAYQIPVSSTKSMHGHMLGAAGAVEAIVCAMAIQDSFVPATIHLYHSDPDCDLDYVPHTGRSQQVNYALSNSFGFGGHNACILLGKPS